MESFNTSHESFDAPESIKVVSDAFGAPESVTVSSQTFQPAIADTRIADLQEMVLDLTSRLAQLESRCDRCSKG